jgi:hypothetical protein
VPELLAAQLGVSDIDDQGYPYPWLTWREARSDVLETVHRRQQGVVTRGNVLAATRSAREDGFAGHSLLVIYAMSLMWGWGGQIARFRPRIERVRRSLTHADDLIKTLSECQRQLDLGRVEGAYGTLHEEAKSSIEGVGPAFGTKLLYFLGESTRGGTPLIYDSMVKRAVSWLNGEPKRELPFIGWDEREYLDYLKSADAWKDVLECNRRDQVEAFLWCQGKGAPRLRKGKRIGNPSEMYRAAANHYGWSVP